ncbi:MAG: hypothetical protein EXX96DRAFT_537532 [Benjaminiella poitrasii]|nr:MAG: hypothetical protein EXX96DRAFT_537532 [Benjaminiella poitrasii]
MSLLNKISGFAQRAKENVVSKTFISKDRRLAKPLSENIKANEIYFEKISTYGLPSTINVIAFDCISGLLAVAGVLNNNYIKIFGKGVSSMIKLPTSAGIKYLQFKIGYPTLIVIDKCNVIMTIDLRTKSIQHALQAQAIITSQTYCTGTDWLFIGYANGFIDVFDITQGLMSSYQIPNLLQDTQSEQEERERTTNYIVVDLQMHPTDLNILLIGYESKVFIWNIRESSIRRSFSLCKSDKFISCQDAKLTCFAWSPDGIRFVAGYDDGYIHLWDVKNGNKPSVSHKLSENFSPNSTLEDQTSLEPVYQIAWYSNEAAQKSYIVIAGGVNPSTLQGLRILEFDQNNGTKEAKKQTIVPLPIDLSHFLILSSNPYYLGMRDPFGIAILGIDHCLRVYGLEHDFPSLKLPPALEFIGPNVHNACHIPQLPMNIFEKIVTSTNYERNVRYLPITGGLTGPEHVYRIASNDLLVTIHQNEIVKFWNASYTALRPLPHLTIDCLQDIDDKNAFLYCLDVNKIDGTLSIGFSNGTIIVYEFQEDLEVPDQLDFKLRSRNEELINNCENTLQEISDLLEDMETGGSDSEKLPHEVENITNHHISTQRKQNEMNSDTNPFLSSTASVDESQVLLLPTHVQPNSSIFNKIDKQSCEKAGFFTALKITLHSSVKYIISIGQSIISVATDDGQLYVLDIHKQLVLFSHNVAQSDYQNSTVNSSVDFSKTDKPSELEGIDNTENEQNKPAFITSLKAFNTYSPLKITAITTQLYVSLSNGHVYSFDLSLIRKGLKVTRENLNTHLAFKLDSQLSDPSASVPDGQSPFATDLNCAGNITDHNTSKRMAAIGKADYRHQENPHMIIFVSINCVNIYLSGFNIKLYSKEVIQNQETKIVRGQIVSSNDSVCLCLLLSDGKLVFYSLPVLDFIFEVNLPSHCLLDKLQEASISSDGRIVFWTGAYEIEQYSFIPKNETKVTEQVFLFDPQRNIPPHPSTLLQQQQRPNKSWLDAVTNAFQREPLTLNELNLLMGRMPVEDHNEVRKKKIEAYKAKIEHQQNTSNSKNEGLGGVFSELGVKMNERGERLNQLDKKFQDMNAASGDFLKAVKDYNERQVRKKWWEFYTFSPMKAFTSGWRITLQRMENACAFISTNYVRQAKELYCNLQ